MNAALLFLCLSLSPSACPQGCSPACVCGCNRGDPCRCLTISAKPSTPAPSASEPVTQNFGIDIEKLKEQTRPRYTLGDREVTREEALAAVEAPEIPDESNKLRLVVIGSETDRKRVLSDLESYPGLQKLKDSVVVNAYPAGSVVLKHKGFVVDGSPSIYLLAPDGKVLGRNLDGQYHGPAVLTAAIEQAQGKPYDPNKDPDLKPKPPEPKQPDQFPARPFDPGQLPGWVWLALGAGAFLWLNSRTNDRSPNQ